MTSARTSPLGPGELTPAEAREAVKSGKLKRRSLADLDRVIGEIAMRAEWGDRCGEFEPECPACQAWARFDRGEV